MASPMKPSSGTKQYTAAAVINFFLLPESPTHKPPTRTFQVTNALVATSKAEIAYSAHIEWPYAIQKPRRIIIKGARSAHDGSQTERKTSTNSHDIPALKAATFILVTIISPVAKGRIATNAGSAKSLDQKSALEKPLPKGNARIIGMAKVHAKIQAALPASSLRNQESGAMTRIKSAPIQDGKRSPAR